MASNLPIKSFDDNSKCMRNAHVETRDHHNISKKCCVLSTYSSCVASDSTSPIRTQSEATDEDG